MMIYLPASPNQYFCTIWQNTGKRKSHFSLKCCIILLCQCLSMQSLLILQSCWLATHTRTPIWLPKSCINGVQLWLWGLYSSGEMKLRVSRCSNWTVLCTGVALSCWKTKLPSTKCMITANINVAETVRYPSNTVHRLSLQARRKTTPYSFWYSDLTDRLVKHARNVWYNRRMDDILPSSDIFSGMSAYSW